MARLGSLRLGESDASRGTVRTKSVETDRASNSHRWITKCSPFRYFKRSLEIIRLAVMRFIRVPLSLRNAEDLLHERDIESNHEAVREWWSRFDLMFAAQVWRKRVDR